MWSGNWNHVLQISSGHSHAHIESSLLIECVQVFKPAETCVNTEVEVPILHLCQATEWFFCHLLYNHQCCTTYTSHSFDKSIFETRWTPFMKTWFGDEIFDSDQIESSPPQSPARLLSFDIWKILSVFSVYSEVIKPFYLLQGPPTLNSAAPIWNSDHASSPKASPPSTTKLARNLKKRKLIFHRKEKFNLSAIPFSPKWSANCSPCFAQVSSTFDARARRLFSLLEDKWLLGAIVGGCLLVDCWKLSHPAHPTKRQSESLASEDDLVARLLLRLTWVFHIVDIAQRFWPLWVSDLITVGEWSLTPRTKCTPGIPSTRSSHSEDSSPQLLPSTLSSPFGIIVTIDLVTFV